MSVRTLTKSMESPEIVELLALAASYERLQLSVQSARAHLRRLSRAQAIRRQEAESQAMLLKDCLGRAPHELMAFYARPLWDMPLADARRELLTLFKSRGGESSEYKRLRAGIDDVMGEIATPKNLLSVEETLISELRDTELYDTLIGQVRREDKAHKRRLRRLELSTEELRQCCEQSRDEISNATESLFRERQEARQLLVRRQAAERENLKLRALETELEELNQRKERLWQEEAQCYDRISELAIIFSDRREAWFVLKATLARAEDEISQIAE